MSKQFDINQNVSNELVKYIADNLPSDLNTSLDKAICIYVLLCKVLKYDTDYVVYGDVNRTNSISDVTPTNNEVVCYHFAKIYSDLLSLYGIQNEMRGMVNNHMYVSFNYEDMIITCDPTKSGHYTAGYCMADFTNVRFGYLLNGFTAMPYDADINKVDGIRKGLRKSIKEAYKRLNINYCAGYKISEVLNKIYNRENERSPFYTKDRILRMFDSINCVRFLRDCDVENAQILNKITTSLFRDIWDERTENITLYKEEGGKVRLTKLAVVYDEDLRPYFYLLVNGKLVKMTRLQLCDYLINEGWYFRYPPDIDALGIDDMNKVNRLYKQ